MEKAQRYRGGGIFAHHQGHGASQAHLDGQVLEQCLELRVCFPVLPPKDTPPEPDIGDPLPGQKAVPPRPKPVPRGPARWETPQLPPQRRFDHWQVRRGWKQPVRRPPGWAGRGEPGRPGRAGRTAAAAEGPAESRAGSASGARRFCLKRGKGPGKPPRPDLWRGRVPARW